MGNMSTRFEDGIHLPVSGLYEAWWSWSLTCWPWNDIVARLGPYMDAVYHSLPYSIYKSGRDRRTNGKRSAMRDNVELNCKTAKCDSLLNYHTWLSCSSTPHLPLLLSIFDATRWTQLSADCERSWWRHDGSCNILPTFTRNVNVS